MLLLGSELKLKVALALNYYVHFSAAGSYTNEDSFLGRARFASEGGGPNEDRPDPPPANQMINWLLKYYVTALPGGCSSLRTQQVPRGPPPQAVASRKQCAWAKDAYVCAKQEGQPATAGGA